MVEQDFRSMAIILAIVLVFALFAHGTLHRYSEIKLRSDIDRLESRIQKLEKDIAAAQWDADWATNLIVTNMESVAAEIRRINAKVGMSPWGWSVR